MGGAFNSGAPGATDAFLSIFWFADALGVLALNGARAVCRCDRSRLIQPFARSHSCVDRRHSLFCRDFPLDLDVPRPLSTRQTLLGGSYALVSLGNSTGGNASSVAAAVSSHRGSKKHDSSTRGVSPDFYVLVLWRRLMGTRILSAWTVSQHHQSTPAIRAYAACTAKGGTSTDGATIAENANSTVLGESSGAVTVVLMNLGRSSIHLDVSNLVASFHKETSCDDLVAEFGEPRLIRPARPSAAAAALVARDDSYRIAWEACAVRCAANPRCVAFAEHSAEVSRNCSAFEVENISKVDVLPSFTPLSSVATDDSAPARDSPAPRARRSRRDVLGPLARCFRRQPYATFSDGKQEARDVSRHLRLEYVLSSDGPHPISLHSHRIRLNGKLLRAEDRGTAGTLPLLVPRVVSATQAHNTHGIFKLPPLSLSFLVFPKAQLHICSGAPTSASASMTPPQGANPTETK
eukprot:scaffold152884_cov29-Tisochrysis_lutea.AAC.2